MGENMNFYEANLAIITRRWPNIAKQLCAACYDISQVELVEDKQLSLVFNGIQLASSYDQEAEASIQVQSLITDVSKVTLYGTGLGLVQKILLKKSTVATLDVIILNFPLFKACLTYFDHQYWLLDERVALKSSKKQKKIHKPFIALPAELVLAKNESASLRDRLCLTLDDDFIRQNKGSGNSALKECITRNLSYIQNDNDVKELFSMNHYGMGKTHFIVCGAGPTLAEHYTWLQKKSTRQNFTLVVVDAAVMPLARVGIIADIVVSIDPAAKKLFDDLHFDDFEHVPLVYFPLVTEALLSSWQGPRFTAYSSGELYQEINEKYPRGRLYSGGSVIHPAIDLAVKMAAKKILLLGTDFSFPDGQSHTYWNDQNSNNSIHVTAENTTHWVLNSLNERVPTLLNYRGYLRDLEDYISLAKHVDFFNGSKKGALISGTRLWSEEVYEEFFTSNEI